MQQYSRTFQEELVLHLARDTMFLKGNIGRLQLDDFTYGPCRVVFEALRRYFLLYRDTPPFNILVHEVENVVINRDGTSEASIIREELVYLAGLMQAIGTMPSSSLRTAYFQTELVKYLLVVRVARITSIIDPATHPAEYAAEMSKMDSELKRMGSGGIPLDDMHEMEPEAILTEKMGFGVRALNEPFAGGLARGQTGMVIAGTGVGKTTGMISFMVGNILHNWTYDLFISLEMPKAPIKHRYQSMLGYLDASCFTRPQSRWSAEERERAAYIWSKECPTYGHAQIADMSDKPYTVGHIEDAISRWQDDIALLGKNPEEVCGAVYVDWLDKIDQRSVVQGMGVQKTSNEERYLTRISEMLGEIARRKKVALWTASQITRDGRKREVLGVEHTAHGYHKNDALDISIAFAPQKSTTEVEYKYASGEELIDDGEGKKNSKGVIVGPPPCNRILIASFLKSRYTAVTGQWKALYQGPTLRLWDNKVDADNNMELIRIRGLDGLKHLLANPAG